MKSATICPDCAKLGFRIELISLSDGLYCSRCEKFHKPEKKQPKIKPQQIRLPGF